MKKRLFSLLLTLCLVLALLPTAASAESVKKNGVTYSVTGGTATVTDCDTSLTGVLTIPDTVNGSTVTTIGSYAFHSCSKLTGIVIPSSVGSIENYAFSFCEALRDVTIPSSVTSLGNNAFNYCKSLTSVTIPDSVTSVGKAIFYSCEALQTVTLPRGLTAIPESMFYNCTALTTYAIPDGVTSIGKSAFERCRALTSVTIPDGVTTIEKNAFYDCDALTEATLPEGVTTVGEDAFYSCDSLTRITVPGSVTSLGDYAFHSSALADLYYGGSYNDWTQLSKSVRYLLDSQTVVHCADASAPLTWETVDGAVKITGCDPTFSGALTIPSELDGLPVTEIAEKAMKGHAGITSVTIPGSVKIIGVSAFEGCGKLTSLTLGEGVEKIYSSAFRSCDLRALRIPRSVTLVGGYAFKGNANLPYVRDYSDSYGSSAYDDGAVVIVMQGWCGEHLEWGVAGGSALHVLGTGDMDNYSAAVSGGQPWEFYKQKIYSVVLHEGVTSVGNYAFNGADMRVGKVTLPQSLRRIGDYAFQNNTRLTAVALPDGLTAIGRGAFAGTGLTEVTIPAGVTRLPVSAFDGCGSLRTVWFPQTLTQIDATAFRGATALADVYYPGLRSQWDTVRIGTGNEPLLAARLHCREAGTVAGFVDVREGMYYADPVQWAVRTGVTVGTSPDTFSPDNTCTRAQVVTFLWRAAGSPEPSRQASLRNFGDVPGSAYYYKAVLWAAENGITSGTSAYAFSPDDPCTRAHVVTFLWRAMGSPAVGSSNPFTDVGQRLYYTDAVLWAVAQNITKGTTATTFSPNAACTRGQIVTFLYRTYN